MLKRCFDFIVALHILLIAFPVFLLVAAMVRLNLGAPILFSQSRPGKNGRMFKMVKFRSMRDIRDDSGLLRSDSERITRFGQLLRSTSLDELPELWNVLKGDMSLVGPRPLLVEYLPLYSTEQHRRHEVRPGVTGWAQVNGRNNLSWEERFKMDVWYVDNQTFWLDLKILFMTVKKVLFREDVNQSGHATAEKFKGTDR